MADSECEFPINDEELSDAVLALLPPENNNSSFHHQQDEADDTRQFYTIPPNQVQLGTNVGLVNMPQYQLPSSSTAYYVNQSQPFQSPHTVQSLTAFPTAVFSNGPSISVLPQNQQIMTIPTSVVNTGVANGQFTQIVAQKTNMPIPSHCEVTNVLARPADGSTVNGFPNTIVIQGNSEKQTCKEAVSKERSGSKEKGLRADEYLAFKRERNRRYAKKSRDRKQTQLALMEVRLDKLQRENEMLKALLRMQDLDEYTPTTTEEADSVKEQDLNDLINI